MRKPQQGRREPEDKLDLTWWLTTVAVVLAGLLIGEAIVYGYILQWR